MPEASFNFNKNIKITCNSKQSPILFRIQGTVIKK